MTNGSQNSYRFTFWLSLFAALLVFVPIAILSGFILLAKIIGISLLVLLIIAMRNWFRLARKKNNRVERIQLNANDLFLLYQIIPAFKSWSVSDQRILTDQIGLFLAEVRFVGPWSSKAQLTVALVSALASWESGYTNKQHWTLHYVVENAFYFEQVPATSLFIPTSPMVGNDISTLQRNEIITKFRAGMAHLK